MDRIFTLFISTISRVICMFIAVCAFIRGKKI